MRAGLRRGHRTGVAATEATAAEIHGEAFPMKRNAQAASIFIVLAGAWSSLAHADRLSTLGALRNLCGAKVAALGRALFPPAPATIPRLVSAIPEVPEEQLAIYSATPLGARVRFRVGTEPIEGVVASVNFSKVSLHTETGSQEFLLSGVRETTVVDSEPFISDDLAATIAENAPTDRRLRQYLAFQRLSDAHWKELSVGFSEPLAAFRALDRRSRTKRLHELATSVDAVARRAMGTNDYALHFNSKGAPGHQYVESGGIRATEGDSELGFSGGCFERGFVLTSSSERAPGPKTVFYYDSGRSGLGHYTLGVRSQSVSNLTSHHYVMAFDAKAIVAEKRGNAYHNSLFPAVQFPQLPSNGIGVVYERDFLLPPLLLKADVPRRLGHPTLTHEEQSLAALLHLEALLNDPALPKPRG